MVDTLEYAENTDVFYIQDYITFKDEEIFNVDGFYIGKCSLYDFVMASAEETTSPRGVERKLHIREVGLEKERNVFYTHYEVWNWGWRGHNPKRLEIFETEVEAIAYIYELTEKFDFANDCNRDTRYYLELTEAMNELAIMLSEKWRVSEDVAAHIIRKHKDIVPGLLAKRKDKEIQLLAEKYANLIEPQMEHFRDTVTRLSEVIESPYNDEAFTRAIQIIRTRYGNMKVLKEDTFSVTIEMTKEDYYNIINSFIDIGANKLKNDFPIAFPSIDRFVMLHGVEKGLYGEINKLLGK